MRKLFLMVGGAGAIVCVLALLFNPWIFFIGGRFTPLPMWHGYGRFFDGRGRPYLLYINVGYAPPGSSSDSTSDLEGGALVCDVNGTVETWDARLETNLVWLNTDGKGTNLHLTRPHGRYPDGGARYDIVDLKGVWRNPNIILEDKGGLAAFAGSRRGPAPGDTPLTATIAYASQRAFEAACQANRVVR